MPRNRLDTNGHEQTVGDERTVDVPPESLQLQVLRERRALAAAKFGGGVGICLTFTGAVTLPFDPEA